MNVKIKRSYITVITVLIFTFAVIPATIFFELCTGLFNPQIWYIWFIYTIVFLLIYFSLSGNINTLITIYNRYKVAMEDPRRKTNSIQLVTANSLSNLTFTDIFRVRKLMKQEKRRVKRIDSDINNQPFELKNCGIIGSVFYNKEKIHSFAMVILIDEKNLIVFDDAFSEPLFFKTFNSQLTNKIKQEFEEWANMKGIDFDYLTIDDDI